MPIYEYRCDACQKVISLLVRSVSNPPQVQCRFCRSDRLTRLISRVVTPKSEDRRLESLADPSALGGLDENDPKSMTRWMKKMAGEMGEDFDDEALSEMESMSDETPGENTESAV
jgi:putative FmdB family regulatory protein